MPSPPAPGPAAPPRRSACGGAHPGVGRAIGLVGRGILAGHGPRHQQALNDPGPGFWPGFAGPSGGEAPAGRPQWLPFPSGCRLRVPPGLVSFSSQRLGQLMARLSGLLLLLLLLAAAPQAAEAALRDQQLRRQHLRPLCRQRLPGGRPAAAWSRRWLITAPPWWSITSMTARTASASRRCSNELQRLWGRSVELIPLTTDALQNRQETGRTDPAHYWKGDIPRWWCFDPTVNVVFDDSGQG